MFNFRFFPGVDFSKINLDWIMRKIGLLEAGQKTVEEAAEQATAAAEHATTAAEQATTAAEDATEAVEAVVGTANEAKQIAQNALTQADIARNEFKIKKLTHVYTVEAGSSLHWDIGSDTGFNVPGYIPIGIIEYKTNAAEVFVVNLTVTPDSYSIFLRNVSGTISVTDRSFDYTVLYKRT